MALGPLMLDLAGTELQAQERERLRHPLVGGVILFSRNYQSPEQLAALTQAIHQLREPQLLIGVDHEGGRVQRFRDGFTALPPMRPLGAIYDDNRKRAKRLAHTIGWVMATELRAVGIDFSFAPVLDLDRGVATVIGDRAFHRDPEAVADLAHAYMGGMTQAGMVATGKHFPGHGGCAEDSHLTLPVDERELADLEIEDLVPFERLIHYGIAAVMAAHVLYPHVDSRPAGFSRFWMTEVLRRRLGFQGVIFSDDLSMGGAKEAGDIVDRVRAVLTAGCDMALVCNDIAAADRVLDGLDRRDDPVSRLRLVRLHGRPAPSRAALVNDTGYRDAVRVISHLA